MTPEGELFERCTPQECLDPDAHDSGVAMLCIWDFYGHFIPPRDRLPDDPVWGDAFRLAYDHRRRNPDGSLYVWPEQRNPPERLDPHEYGLFMPAGADPVEFAREAFNCTLEELTDQQRFLMHLPTAVDDDLAVIRRQLEESR